MTYRIQNYIKQRIYDLYEIKPTVFHYFNQINVIWTNYQINIIHDYYHFEISFVNEIDGYEDVYDISDINNVYDTIDDILMHIKPRKLF